MNDTEQKILKESRINNKLTIRKKQYEKILNYKRKLISEINILSPNISSDDSNTLNVSDLLKILTNEQILNVINEFKTNKQKFYENDITILFQFLFSIDYNLNINYMDSIAFIKNNQIYIFILELIESSIKLINQKDSNINNNLGNLIIKNLQIIFKFTSYEDLNIQMANYIKQQNIINCFIYMLTLLEKNYQPEKNKLTQLTNHQKNDIILYLITILYNISLVERDFLIYFRNNKIEEKLI